MRRNGFAIAVWLLMTVLASALMTVDGSIHSASAQTTVETAVDEPSPNDIREFHRLLANPSIQNWLQKQAAQVDTPASGPAVESFREQLTGLAGRIRQRVGDLREAALHASDAPTIMIANWRNHMTFTDTLRILTYILIFLFVGAGLEWLYRQYTHYRLLALELHKPDGLGDRLATAGLRALITLGGLAAFAFGSVGTFLTFNWPPVIDEIVLNVLIVVLTVRIITTISRFFLAPNVVELRLVPFTNSQARSVHRWIAFFVFIRVTNYALADIFQKLASLAENSVPRFAALAIEVGTNLIWVGVGLLAIWKIRNLFSGAQRQVGRFWATYLTVLIVSAFFIWLLGTPSLLASWLILGWLFPVLAATRLWINNLFDQAEKTDALHGSMVEPEEHEDLVEVADAGNLDGTDTAGEQFPVEVESTAAEEGRYETYRPIATRLVRFLIVVCAVVGLMIAWEPVR